MSENPIKILIADDEEVVLEIMARKIASLVSFDFLGTHTRPSLRKDSLIKVNLD